MNVLGISGSPNKNGNTAYAVQYALGIVSSNNIKTRYISLAGKKIEYCIGCWQCIDKQACIKNDDMPEILEAMRWCDGLIIGSPVYFGLISGQLKTMFDRTVMLRPRYDEPFEMAGKTGCGISCGFFRNGGQEITLQNIQTYMLQQGMQVINDGPGFSHSGGTIIGEKAQDDTVGLETISKMMNHLINMLKK